MRTKALLAQFGLATPRDLPDFAALEEAGLLAGDIPVIDGNDAHSDADE